MEDVAPKLYSQIRKLFDKAVDEDRQLQRIENWIRDGTATQKDVLLYSQRLGRHASEACRAVLTPENLPDGKLYYNIAERTVKKLCQENEAEILARASKQNAAMNAAAGVGLKAKKPKRDRTEDLVNAMCNEYADADAVARLLGEPLMTVHASVVDDFLRTNADLADRAGLAPVIVREYDGVGVHDGKDACQWCLERAGRWTYGEAYERGVFERHTGCGCTVTFEYGQQSQDVYSKAVWDTGNDEARKTAIMEKQEDMLRQARRKTGRIRDREVFLREQMNSGKTFADAWAAYEKRR